jgi:hypothetical protein
MNDSRSAKKLRNLSLKAISRLSQILPAARDRSSTQEFARISKAIGLAIAQIQTEILDPISSRYPELDDLT